MRSAAAAAARVLPAKAPQPAEPQRQQRLANDNPVPDILLQGPAGYLIHWQVQADSGNDDWHDYTLEFSARLEANRLQGLGPFEFVPGKHKLYRYDTQAMTQLNTWQNTRRVMRRVCSLEDDYWITRGQMRQIQADNQVIWDAMENQGWSSNPSQGGGWQSSSGGKGSRNQGQSNYGSKGGNRDYHRRG